MARSILILVLAFAPLCGCHSAPTREPIDVLVFSRTAGFRHSSIPAGIKALNQLCFESGYTCSSTEDATVFETTNLAQYDVIIFLNTTGDILDESQQAAFEDWFTNPGKQQRGFVGIHAAADTEYDWPFYRDLLGGQFKSHPAVQQAVVVCEDASHPSTAHLPKQWQRTDEWYNYRTNPRESGANVLLNLDTASYQGDEMEGDHPIAWCRQRGSARMFYTGGGHTEECYSEPLFLQHILGGIRWAAHDERGISAMMQH